MLDYWHCDWLSVTVGNYPAVGHNLTALNLHVEARANGYYHRGRNVVPFRSYGTTKLLQFPGLLMRGIRPDTALDIARELGAHNVTRLDVAYETTEDPAAVAARFEAAGGEVTSFHVSRTGRTYKWELPDHEQWRFYQKIGEPTRVEFQANCPDSAAFAIAFASRLGGPAPEHVGQFDRAPREKQARSTRLRRAASLAEGAGELWLAAQLRGAADARVQEQPPIERFDHGD